MKVTNVSNKIIGIGELTLLPGKTDTIPAEFEGNPTIEFFVQRGTLVEGDGTDKKHAQTGPSNAELEDALRGAIAAAEAAEKRVAEEATARKEAEAKAATEAEARKDAEAKAEAAVKAAEDAKAAAEAKTAADAKAVETAKNAKNPK